MNPITYRDWPDAVRLSNGTAELIVVPSIGGRIMRYGLIGGENLLWEHEELAGASPSTKPYRNFGGDKAWPWPQDRWKKLVGGVWPPPAAYDQAPFACEQLDPLAIRLTSPVAPEFGFRIVREIRLSQRGSRVTIDSRLVPEPGHTVVSDAMPWHVTQMPVPDLLLARVAPDAGEQPFRPLPPQPWKAPVTSIDRDVLQLHRPSDVAAKLGMDADILAWVKGSTFLIQRLQTPSPAGYAPCERAQVFSQAKPPYVELEFTAPPGGTPLRVTWELHDLPRDLTTAEAVAAYIARL